MWDWLRQHWIGIVVPVAAILSLGAGVALPYEGQPPAVALETEWILYGLRALGIFYGFLLFFVPVIRALRGELPIELSLRGARYEAPGAAVDALEALDDEVKEQRALIDDLTDALSTAAERVAALEGGEDEPTTRE